MRAAVDVQASGWVLTAGEVACHLHDPLGHPTALLTRLTVLLPRLHTLALYANKEGQTPSGYCICTQWAFINYLLVGY